MEPSITQTRNWLVFTVCGLAVIAVVTIALGGSWLIPAIYAVLFLPLLLRVYLDLRRRQK